MILAAVSSPQPYRPSSSEPTWRARDPIRLATAVILTVSAMMSASSSPASSATRPDWVISQAVSACWCLTVSSAPGICPGSSSCTNQRSRLIAAVRCTAAWGESIGSCVGLAYVRAGDNSVINADWVKAGSYQVNVGGQLYPITVSLRPIYDPTSEKIRP